MIQEKRRKGQRRDPPPDGASQNKGAAQIEPPTSAWQEALPSSAFREDGISLTATLELFCLSIWDALPEHLGFPKSRWS